MFCICFVYVLYMFCICVTLYAVSRICQKVLLQIHVHLVNKSNCLKRNSKIPYRKHLYIKQNAYMHTLKHLLIRFKP